MDPGTSFATRVGQLEPSSARRAANAGRVPFLLYLWPVVFLAVGLAVCYTLAKQQHAAGIQRQRDDIRARLEPISAELSRELFAAIHLTQGIASLAAIEGDVSETRFRRAQH